MDVSIAARRAYLCLPVMSRPRLRRRRPPRLERAPARARRPPPPPSPDRFRGVRIFDISDLSNPKQVATVQSCRGSHTHTLVIDPKDKDNVYIYISGTGAVRQSEELAECSGGEPTENPDTALFRIDIIKVPLAHPEQAKIVSSPRIFTDAQTGAMNGLWKGGNHGEGTQNTSGTDKCHDITVYSAMGLAAGACSGNGILLNISDPVNPVRIAAVSDPNYAFWHSANFNNAGTKVLFTDEWGGGGQPRCRATDPMNWGADAIFNLSKGKLTLASYYKMPAPQTDMENCVAHNGSLVPIPGRDILVQSWYQGGISLVDFTDAAHPSRSPTSIAARWTPPNARWAGNGPPIGTTVTSMVRRSHAASTCSSWCRTNTSRKTRSTPPTRCISTSSMSRTSRRSPGRRISSWLAPISIN